jgi:hypothetical protein
MRVNQGLAIVRAWQPNNKLPKPVFNELKAALVRSQPFQDQQMKVARKVGNKAWDTAVDWANKQGRDTATKREFCWFYDIFTQNGGLKSVTQPQRTGVTPHTLRRYILTQRLDVPLVGHSWQKA